MKLKPKLTEAKIQCELYRQLTNLGYDVWPELPINIGQDKKLRADLAVFKGEEFIVLIEVKKRNKKPIRMESAQFKKYEATGQPFTYCRSMDEIDQTIQYIGSLVPAS